MKKDFILWLLIAFLVSFLTACTKHPITNNCNTINIVSDFYFADSTYYRSDTSKFDYGCIADSDIIKIKATPDMWFNLCYNSPPIFEHCRYVVNGKTIYPLVIFKK